MTKVGVLGLRRGSSGSYYKRSESEFYGEHLEHAADGQRPRSRQDGNAADESGWSVQHPVNTTWTYA